MILDYEAALNKTNLLDPKEAMRYGTLCGVLQFATAMRPDVAYPVGVCGRCRTFPTTQMMQHLERILVYLGRTAALGLHYVSGHPDSAKLSGCSDSDWYTRRSTTGYDIRLAQASIAHGSRRQHCIALSSCEAEMILAQAYSWTGKATIGRRGRHPLKVLRFCGHDCCAVLCLSFLGVFQAVAPKALQAALLVAYIKLRQEIA